MKTSTSGSDTGDATTQRENAASDPSVTATSSETDETDQASGGDHSVTVSTLHEDNSTISNEISTTPTTQTTALAGDGGTQPSK